MSSIGPREWFELLFGAMPHGWLTVSTKRDAGSRSTPGDPFLTRWFDVSDLDAAAAFAERAAAESNVYFGLGVRRGPPLGENQRGCAQDVLAILGLWLEVDVAGGTHEGSPKGYFPTKAAVLEFLYQGIPHPPSVVINSGGGLHAYWLFREPLIIEEKTDFELAAGLVRGWQAFVRSRTLHEIDSTHDLARVLRVPGTWNRKNGMALEVSTVEVTDRRYSPDDFAEWIEIGDRVPMTVPGGLVVREGVEPPGLKFFVLRENDKRFRDHWDEKPINPRDNSASAHCLGLATIAVKAGWTNQEIVDLLVAFLANSKVTKHRKRSVAWYGVTIAKARHGNEDESDIALLVHRASTANEPEEKLGALSALLGFPIKRIVRRFHVDEHTGLTMDPWYIIETDGCRVEIENADVLMSRSRFRSKCLGHVARMVRVKASGWDDVAEAIAAAAITEDLPPEANPCEQVRGAVREYLERRTITDDPVAAHDSNQILERDGRQWFSASRWIEWARMRKGMDVGRRNVAQLLTIAGCKRMALTNLARRGGRTTNLTFWCLEGEK